MISALAIGYLTDPAGAAGDGVVCGVIQKP